MKTSDVYLASALLALQFPLINVNRNDPRHMVFEFGSANLIIATQETPVDISEVETMWANRKLTVNAFDFAEAIKRMKSIIHSS